MTEDSEEKLQMDLCTFPKEAFTEVATALRVVQQCRRGEYYFEQETNYRFTIKQEFNKTRVPDFKT